jgi:hypothetical protein
VPLSPNARPVGRVPTPLGKLRDGRSDQMERSNRRARCRRRNQLPDWVQLAALILTAVTAIAGCIEHFV